MDYEGEIRLTKEEIAFVVRVTGESTEDEALETFALLMMDEFINPNEMSIYVKKMMERENK